MAVKLELYRVFKEVAETGNISVAAKNALIAIRITCSKSCGTTESKENPS